MSFVDKILMYFIVCVGVYFIGYGVFGFVREYRASHDPARLACLLPPLPPSVEKVQKQLDSCRIDLQLCQDELKIGCP